MRKACRASDAWREKMSSLPHFELFLLVYSTSLLIVRDSLESFRVDELDPGCIAVVAAGRAGVRLGVVLEGFTGERCLPETQHEALVK